MLRFRTGGLLFAVLTLFLAACDGDPRPLQEAVTAQEVGLTTLVINAENNPLRPIRINPGEQVQFIFSASNSSGESVSLSTNDRRWSSSASAVGSISASGLFTATGEGSTTIALRVAGVPSNEIPLVVADARLIGIQSVRGADQVSECSRNTYTASGNFSDGFARPLSNIEWSLSGFTPTGNDGEDTTLISESSIEAVVAARASGSYTLTATQGGFSAAIDVQVLNNLASIDIVGVPAVAPQVGETLQLIARANHNDISSVGLVTDVVRWTVTAPSVIARFQPVSGGAGRLTALSPGAGQIEAFCGSLSARMPLTVRDAVFENFRIFSGPDADSQGTSPVSSVTILVGNTRTFTLTAVSTIDGEETRSDVTSVASWELVGDDDVASLDTDEDVVVTAETVGRISLEATIRGESGRVDIMVSEQ